MRRNELTLSGEECLRTACQVSGASGACMISSEEGKMAFECGYEVSENLASAIHSQIKNRNINFELQQVSIGLESMLCLIVNQKLQETITYTWMLIFASDYCLTERIVGRVEGIIKYYLLLSVRVTKQRSPFSPFVCVCSFCDRLQAKGAGWLRWNEYLRLTLNMTFSHTSCPSCAKKLFSSLLDEDTEAQLR